MAFTEELEFGVGITERGKESLPLDANIQGRGGGGRVRVGAVWTHVTLSRVEVKWRINQQNN
jgi:hypothetical protein